MDAVFVLTYGEQVRVFSDYELALREAVDIAFQEASGQPQYFDMKEINRLICDQQYERVIAVFNDEANWWCDGLLIREAKVEKRCLGKASISSTVKDSSILSRTKEI